MQTASYETIVIGGGPAGCAAAAWLVRRGHRVLLLDQPGPHDHGLAVSVPPSARRTLEAAGLLAAIDAAAPHPWRGNTVWWADDVPRTETFPPGLCGFHIVGAELRRLALGVARDAGVEVRLGLARSVRLPPAAGEPVRVEIEAGARHEEARAPLVLDCSGRRGVIARDGLRLLDPDVRTIALTGVWQRSSTGDPFDETHTLVASYADGWAWSIPTAPGRRYVTVMVDPQRTERARGDSAAGTYARELAKIARFRPLLERGTPVCGPWGHDASLYSARRYAGPGFLLVGDAASFVDPLSSAGVKKAVASAWVAAVAAHTALSRPGLMQVALAFHDRRERHVYAAFQRRAARFATAVAERNAHPFWTARALAQEADDHPKADPDLGRDPAVRAALEDLRRRRTVRLRVAAGVEVAPRPAIRGDEIALIDHFVLPDRPEGIRYVGGVDLVPLAALAPRYTTVGDIIEAHARRSPTTPLPTLLAALAFLLSRGVLLHEAERDR